MEIAILQALISQENRAGGGATGGVDSVLITEGTHADAGYTSASSQRHDPVVFPYIWQIDDRGNSPSGDFNWTSTPDMRTYLASQAYSEGLLARLYHGQHFTSTTGTRHERVGQATQLHFLPSQRHGGVSGTWLTSNNNTSYGPFWNCLMFMKNVSASTQTLDVNIHSASRWASGYDGAGGCFWMPNSSDYNAVSSVTWSAGYNYQGSTSNVSNNMSISVPAGRTVAVHHAHTLGYWTTFSSGGHWYYAFNPEFEGGGNMGDGTATTSNPVFKPDLRMTLAFYQYRNYTETQGNGITTGSQFLVDAYKTCGAVFGNEETP